MNELARDLTPDMLSSELYKKIADAIGIDNFYKLAKVVGGATIYIPLADSLTRPVRDVRIKTEFNGYNHLELAKRYGVTERWVRQLCGLGQMEGQTDLFDALDAEADDYEQQEEKEL